MESIAAIWRGPSWVLGVQLGSLTLLLLWMYLRGHWRSDWKRSRIRSAYRAMDGLDEREAADGEYEPLLKELGQGLPAWAASPAAGRLSQSDSRSRRRCLEILSQSDFSPFRERLVDLARDSSDPLAGEIWEMLSGRHRSGWKNALLSTEGRAGFADPPPPPSGPWCGFYTQLGAEHRMDFTLTFDGETFLGAGRDITGPFTISGQIVQGKQVRATKRYNLHSVEYMGSFDGDAIVGTWSLAGGSGKFRLWPRRQKAPPPAPVKA